MDDVLRRIGNVETSVSVIQSEVSGLKAEVGGLTKKVDGIAVQLTGLAGQVTGMTAQLSGVTASLEHSATKTDVLHVEVTMLRWLVATILAATSLGVVILKYT